MYPTKGWPAPAKLNLFLHITGRREDGYHLLQSVFQFLDYCDELFFSVRQDGLISRVREVDGVPEEQDLIVRAARLLQQESGTTLGADIDIAKHLPMGGGLGGGSSDAATTLVALNQLWGTGFSEEQLARLGLRLGADVPVFVRGHAAWAEGIGEKLIPVDPPEPWYLVIHPAIHVATGAVFNAPELTRDCPPITIRDFLAGAGSNVCEPVVRQTHPQVAEALDWLNKFAKARLTGTGACIFASFALRDEAEKVLRRLPEKWHGFVARGMNISPLHQRLNNEF